MSKFPVKTGQTFLMIGDSITDCGRTADAGPYGVGYVRMFMDIVAKRHPELNVNWINKGVGGHTVQDLKARWKEDVLDHRPDWLSIMIGINDCARDLAEPLDSSVELFRRDYVDILAQVRPLSPRIVLLDPFLIATPGFIPVADATREDGLFSGLDARLAPYINVVADLARDVGALHVRTHEMFVKQLRYRPPSYFCLEPVHPAPSGHLMIASELYDVIAGG